MTQPADLLAFIERPVGFRGVLHEEQPVIPGEPEDWIHVARVAVDVHR